MCLHSRWGPSIQSGAVVWFKWRILIYTPGCVWCNSRRAHSFDGNIATGKGHGQVIGDLDASKSSCGSEYFFYLVMLRLISFCKNSIYCSLHNEILLVEVSVWSSSSSLVFQAFYPSNHRTAWSIGNAVGLPSGGTQFESQPGCWIYMWSIFSEVLVAVQWQLSLAKICKSFILLLKNIVAFDRNQS